MSDDPVISPAAGLDALITAVRATAEESLAHTWAGGSEIPVGPSISTSFQNAVIRQKELARGVLTLVDALAQKRARCERLEAALRPFAALDPDEFYVGYIGLTPEDVLAAARALLAEG